MEHFENWKALHKGKSGNGSKAWWLGAQSVCESGLASAGSSATNQVCGQGQNP